jgi:hypothetical protein
MIYEPNTTRWQPGDIVICPDGKGKKWRQKAKSAILRPNEIRSPGGAGNTPGASHRRVIPMADPQYTPVRLCAAPDCDRKADRGAFCNMHALRLRRHGSLHLPKKPSDGERFDAKVLLGDRCWLYQPAISRGRYDNFSVWREGKAVTVLAHVYAYERAHGPLGEGLVVRHTCDNPACVRPDHLVAGTYADNSHDAMERDRLATGERHPLARLTEAQVREIRRLRAVGGWSFSRLGARFGISKRTVQNICARRTWRHVVEEAA